MLQRVWRFSWPFNSTVSAELSYSAHVKFMYTSLSVKLIHIMRSEFTARACTSLELDARLAQVKIQKPSATKTD
jgi:hypothetical protein